MKRLTHDKNYHDYCCFKLRRIQFVIGKTTMSCDADIFLPILWCILKHFQLRAQMMKHQVLLVTPIIHWLFNLLDKLSYAVKSGLTGDCKFMLTDDTDSRSFKTVSHIRLRGRWDNIRIIYAGCNVWGYFVFEDVSYFTSTGLVMTYCDNARGVWNCSSRRIYIYTHIYDWCVIIFTQVIIS